MSLTLFHHSFCLPRSLFIPLYPAIGICGLLVVLPKTVLAQNAPAVSFGAANVCPAGQTTPSPCSAAETVTLTIAASGPLAAVQVFTGGVPNLDFTLANGGTCPGSVVAGQQCSVNVTFAPTLPGLRGGAVVLQDGNGNALASTYLYGTGTAPAIAFSPSAVNVLDPSIYNPIFYHPYAVAVDGGGNVFVALPSTTAAIKEIIASSGYTTVNTLGSGFNQPRGVAVDGGGNVFVADTFNHAIKEIVAAGGYTDVVTIISGLSIPSGLAVDGSGNLFFADSGANTVYELMAAGGYATLAPLGSGFSFPQGVAVDGSGNVFVADSANNAVKEILAVGGYTVVNTLGGGFRFPSGVAVDASGDVYVADNNHSLVKEIVAASGYLTVNTLVGATFSNPEGVAVNGGGDVFVANTNASDIVQIQRSQPVPSPAMFFATTPVGDTSGDSPQTVTIQNVGNVALAVTGSLAGGVDFTEVQTPGGCDGISSGLAPGLACTYSIAFAPQSTGVLSDTLTLTDNSLNANGTVQELDLLGSGVVVPPLAKVSASSLGFSDMAFGSTETLGLTVTNAGRGTLTVSPLIDGPSFQVMPGSNCGAGVQAGASCLLQIQFTPRTVGVHKNALTLVTNGANNPVVKLRGAAIGVGLTTETMVKFGPVIMGSTATLPLTVANYGVAGSPTIKVKINGPSFKALPGSKCFTSGVAAGSTCTLQVQFAPVSASSHKDILTATSTISGTISTATLTGTGVAP